MHHVEHIFCLVKFWFSFSFFEDVRGFEVDIKGGTKKYTYKIEIL